MQFLHSGENNETAICGTCFRRCLIREGGTGFCGARICRNGKIIAGNYGELTALALDPIEKKPLARFYPGSKILSIGSYGCNLTCPFCQNYSISKEWEPSVTAWQSGDRGSVSREESKEAETSERTRQSGFRRSTVDRNSGKRSPLAETSRLEPDELADIAEELKTRGNIGVAFTYNEPLVGWEYVRDAAREVKRRGMKTVLVSNGCASGEVLREILPYIDAMNIDLKGFTSAFYRDFVGGDFEMVKAFIQGAVQYKAGSRCAEQNAGLRPDSPGQFADKAGSCHVELTTLVIPGENDSREEMEREAAWIKSLDGGMGEVPLHVTRYFPRYHCRIPATPVGRVYSLAETARKYLKYVYVGNC